MCTLLSVTSTLGSAVIQIILLNSHVEYASRITSYVAKLADMFSYAFGYKFSLCLSMTFYRSKYPKLSSNIPLTTRFKHTFGKSFPLEMFIVRFKGYQACTFAPVFFPLYWSTTSLLHSLAYPDRATIVLGFVQ